MAEGKQVKVASLFVSNLHPDITELTLWGVFNPVAPVVSINICRDRVTRRSLGYGYVNFVKPEDAQRALDMLRDSEIKGRACRIAWSRHDSSLPGSGTGSMNSIDSKPSYYTVGLRKQPKEIEPSAEILDKIRVLLKSGLDATLAEIQPDMQTQMNRAKVFALLRKRIMETTWPTDLGPPARLVLGGSFAKYTDLPGNASDIDVVVIHERFSVSSHSRLLKAIERMLRKSCDVNDIMRMDLKKLQQVHGYDFGWDGDLLEENWATMDARMSHISGALDLYSDDQGVPVRYRFDVLVGGNASSTMVAQSLMQSPFQSERSLWGASLVECHVDLFKNALPSIPQAVRVAKWWRDQVLMDPDVLWKPRSFLLELLILYAEDLRSPVAVRTKPHPYEISSHCISLFMNMLSLIVDWEKLYVVWTWGESESLQLLEKPVVLDPFNPTNNVASTMSWKEWELWGHIAEKTLQKLQY